MLTDDYETVGPSAAMHHCFGKVDRLLFRLCCRWHDGHGLRGATIEWSFCASSSGRALALFCALVFGRAHANRLEVVLEAYAVGAMSGVVTIFCSAMYVCCRNGLGLR